jgi:hypothetical protein
MRSSPRVSNNLFPEYQNFGTTYGFYTTPGVCHSLSSGFELKHDRLCGDDNVKVNLWR